MHDCIGKDILNTFLSKLLYDTLCGISWKRITVKLLRNRLFYRFFALNPDTMLQLFLFFAHGFLCLLFFVLCIGFLALRCKVFILFYKLPDTLFHHVPF